MILGRKLISRSNPQERFLRGFALITVIFPIFHDGISTKSVRYHGERRISRQTDRARNWRHFKPWTNRGEDRDVGTRVRDRSVSKRLFFFFFYRSGYQIDAVLSFSVEIAESHFEIWRKLRKSNVRTILRGRCNYFSFFSRERTSGATTIATHSSSWILSDIEGQWLVWLAGRKILFPVPSSLPV